MATVLIGNSYITAWEISPGVAKALDRATSYLVAGHFFDPRFKRKIWDGREHLMQKLLDPGSYRLPVGLIDVVRKILHEHDVRVTYGITKAQAKPPKLDLPWQGPELRGYQREAVAAFMDPKRTQSLSRGILDMPIRSGKTLTAAAVAHELGTTTIFLVPSQLLLEQTAKAFRKALKTDVGIIGKGIWDPKGVTIASVQMLVARRGKSIFTAKPEYRALAGKFGLVIFDELHHLTGPVWHKVILDIDARYRLGLSATVFLEDSHEIERGVIWLKACTGDVVYKVSASRLVEEGHLLRPDVRLHRVTEPDLSDWKDWSQALKDRGIYMNDGRNQLITDLVVEHVGLGRRTLVVSKSLKQVASLVTRIKAAGIECKSMTGSTPGPQRQKLIAKFIAGDLLVIVGTVFGEGVDIPECEAVINADGGRDKKATVQRMRCLTPSPGKKGAYVDDFMDSTNPYLARHSLERLKVYREEPAFKVRMIPART